MGGGHNTQRRTEIFGGHTAFQEGMQNLGSVVLLSGARLVTQLSELIRVRDRDKDGNNSVEREDEAEDCEFVGYFPSFVWVVRDFTLELRVGERPISEDEYLEQVLELKHGECWPRWGH